MNRQKFLGVFAVAVVLSGCGGGGSDSQPQTPSALSFPLQDAYKALVAKGDVRTFSVSGSCGGSGNRTTAAAKGGATFEGATALSAVTTTTMALSGCTPASSAQTTTSYFDQSYTPLGEVVVGGSYGVYLTPPVIPVAVSVGSAGVIGTLTKYTSSTKTKPTCGTVNLSYAVEADASNTAIVNLIQKDFELPNTGQPIFTTPSTTCASLGPVLTQTAQSRYRITASGSLTPMSTDIQYANGSTAHLVLTYN